MCDVHVRALLGVCLMSVPSVTVVIVFVLAQTSVFALVCVCVYVCVCTGACGHPF